MSEPSDSSSSPVQTSQTAPRTDGFEQRWLAAIVDHSDDAIVGKDLNGTVMSWNGAAERMFGYRADEIIGQSIRRIVPADRQTEEDHVLAVIRRGERVEHFETIRVRKDGVLIPIALSVSPVRDPSGRLIGASKIARDISERRRLEAAMARAQNRDALLAEIMSELTSWRDYRSTLRSLVHMAVPRIADWCSADVLAENGEAETIAVAHCNPDKIALAQLLRKQSDAGQSAATAAGVIRSGTAAYIPQITDAMIVAGAAGDSERLRMVRELGLVSYICVPMVVHQRTLGALTFATAESGREYDDSDLRFAGDVAGRAALIVENARAYEQLQTADRLKDEFLATLSHELRTPLSAMVGYARILRMNAVAADRREHALEVIDRNAASLTQIVEDILDVSRIISGQSRLRVRPIHLGDIIHDAIATVEPAAEARGVHIRTILDLKNDLVSGDADRLRQVVWNLLSNAVKFTSRGGVVELRLQHANTDVEITVRDTGIGIPAAFLPHVFEPFRQVDGGISRKYGGLGLGLAIARHLVEMHGGAIQAMSEGDGKGATFRIALPAMSLGAEPHVECDRTGGRTDAGESADIARPAAALDGVHVLAVDDDDDALALVTDILETAGATVMTANSVDAALERLAVRRPHAIITDMGMPGDDGFELIRRIRLAVDPDLRRIPIAALTAYARPEDRANALRHGFELHLSKPIRPTELIAAVLMLTRRHQQELEQTPVDELSGNQR